MVRTNGRLSPRGVVMLLPKESVCCSGDRSASYLRRQHAAPPLRSSRRRTSADDPDSGRLGALVRRCAPRPAAAGDVHAPRPPGSSTRYCQKRRPQWVGRYRRLARRLDSKSRARTQYCRDQTQFRSNGTARISASVPTQTNFGKDPEWGTLAREINKKARHMPLRQLFGRIPNVLTQLAPYRPLVELPRRNKPNY
jgi:hypothetical protein